MAAYRHASLYAAFLLPYTFDWILTFFIFLNGGVESDSYFWGSKRIVATMATYDIWTLGTLKILVLVPLYLYKKWCDYTRLPTWRPMLVTLSGYFIFVCFHNVGVLWDLTNSPA